MKVRIEKPDGHMLQVEGRVKDVATLLNAWWAGTADDGYDPEPRKITTGFVPNEEEYEHGSTDSD